MSSLSLLFSPIKAGTGILTVSTVHVLSEPSAGFKKGKYTLFAC